MLGREPVEVDMDAISGYLAGATVLVTGAGGSIGAELCRQIERAQPARLVLVDHAEPALFEIERELVDERGFPAGDPGARRRARTQPAAPGLRELPARRVVFHAAAYKHVPLMEANPLEAVRNNVLGTRDGREVAIEHGVERFVLVSTDKAVNPNTVMGQSKALCEWIVGALGDRDDVPTRFVAVRFGNVLGSAGSVIPLFRRQIERGGPVTVTHPEMTRYFMTIPEAVALVVQAGAIGGRGQIFVLDMGEPVRILDLARDMIRLSGKEPGRDIAIDVHRRAAGREAARGALAEGETWRRARTRRSSRLTRAGRRAWLDGRARRAGARSSRRATRSTSSAGSPRSCASRRARRPRGGRDRSRARHRDRLATALALALATSWPPSP